jgi:hypothetical protein
MRSLLLLALLLPLVACGTPGAPQPPSLNIPKPINDLKAVRKGDTVTLSWTAPEDTTDGALVHHSGKMIVRRDAGEGQAEVGEAPLDPVHKSQQSRAETLKDSLTDLLGSSAADFAIYTVEAANNSGKSGGQSNQAAVPLVLTPATPKDVQAKVVPQGVSISWNQSWPPQTRTNLNVQYFYRIMRRLEGANQPPVMVKQISAGNEAALVIDTGIDWERQYQYWVVPVTLWEKDDRQKGAVEGEDSNVVSINTHDVFPPAVPSGLQAVFSQVGPKSFIDLTWIPNTDRDLAGYNIYRRTENTEPVKINPRLLTIPAFHDETVQPGMKYFYSVSAVDLRNNESAKSQEASEAVPPQQ